jgi:hypothetical protein
MAVKLTQSPDRPDEWQVCRDGTVIVCFSGPRAHEQARRRSEELASLLNDGGPGEDQLAVSGAELNATRK